MTTRIRTFIGRPIPGGHHYPIPDGPEVTGESVQELVNKVIEYRVLNGLGIGDPLVEITAYYAVNYPFAVESGDREEPPKLDKLTERVYRWVNYLWAHPPKEFVQADEAERRQKICEECRWRTDPTEDESRSHEEAERRIFLLSRGSLGPDESGRCRWHCHDNRLACLLPMENLDPDGSPKECWVKRT